MKDDGKGDDRLGPRSALRVAMILETLAVHRTGITLSTLSEVLSAPKTSLLALLRVLEGSGYVVVNDFRYFPGPIRLPARRADIIDIRSRKCTSVCSPRS